MSDHSSSPSRAASVVDLSPPGVQTARPYRFTWDPSTRKPGPGSVSEATEGRGDYFAAPPRPEVITSSLTALAPGAYPANWSSSKHGFHAISTVLNNPHKRQAPPKAHSSLPAVPPAELPRVRRKDFDSYLNAISSEWDRFQKNSQLGREGVAQVGEPSTPRASTFSDPVTSPPSLRVPSGKPFPSLDVVPSVFFEPSFDLGNPRIFNKVTEQGDKEDDSSDPSSLSHSLPLLEKFSHYADTVEQHLVREISLRSTSFFAALTNLNDLQSESEQCLDRISKLRGLLKDVDEKSAKRGLEVVRKESKLRNLGTLREGTKLVNGVIETTGVAKSLVAAGQWGEAIGFVEGLERLWTAEPFPRTPGAPETTVVSSLPLLGDERPLSSSATTESSKSPQKWVGPSPSVPLSSLHAFASLPTHLRELTMEIASSLSAEVVNVLRIDLLERMDDEQLTPPEQVDINPLKDRVRPLLHSLVLTKGMREVTLSWREVVLSEIQRVIGRHVPSFDPDDGSAQISTGSVTEPGVGFANHIRNMPHSEFIILLQSIYKSFLNGVVRVQTQGSAIIDVLEGIQPLNPSLDFSALKEEFTDILSSAAELSNVRAAKIIGFRSERHATLDLPEFVTVFNESWDFVVKCEVLCRRMIVGLRGVVVSQAKLFLQAFHQTRISRSAKLVEDEQWNPSEATPHLQHVVDVLVDSAVRDSAELLINGGTPRASSSSPASPSSATNGTLPPASIPASPSALPAKVHRSATSAAASKQIRIEDRMYYAVSATAEVLVLLLDYLRVIVNLSTLTIDTMSRVIEFLKAFNSRTCQVVLGAGAMRSAGLKNITAKHLALASQSLSVMIALIPYVRETFRRHLSSTQAVMLVEFDKLKRDYQEHQNEIHAKLIAIMGDRLGLHIKTLQAIDWRAPKQGVNDYMELLVKETVTLHKVLSRYLSTAIVEDVMAQVFAAINHRLSEEYSRIELPSSEAKTRLLADAKYLHQKLSALKNVGAPSAMLETVVAEKGLGRGTHGEQPSGETMKPASASANPRMTKSPVTDKALPAPTPIPDPPSPGSTPPPVVPNGMGRKSDINGRVTARLSSLMSSRPMPSIPSPREEGAEPEQVKSPPGKLSTNPLPSPPPNSVPAPIQSKESAPLDVVAGATEGSHGSQFEGHEAGYTQPPRNAQLPDGAGSKPVIGDIVRPTSPMKLPVMEVESGPSGNEPPASQSHS